MAKSGRIGALALVAFLLVPAVSCTGDGGHDSPLPARAEELVEAFKSVHAQVYGVYDLGPERDAVFDLLESSFAGPALTREYVEHFTTLHRMRRESTAIRVLRVDYDRVELRPLGPDRWIADTDWSVGGLVFHRGHSHMRVNRYGALYTLEGEGDALRIVDTRMRDVRRVRSAFEGSTGSILDDRAETAGGFLSLGELLRGGVELPEPEGDATESADETESR